MFNDGEQKIINTLPNAINSVKKDLGLVEQQVKQPINNSNFADYSNVSSSDMGGYVNTNKNVRVRTDSSIPAAPVYREPDDYRYNFNNVDYDNNYSDVKNNTASSFVLIVAAVIALIALVSVVTLGILNIIGYKY